VKEIQQRNEIMGETHKFSITQELLKWGKMKIDKKTDESQNWKT
jgi:hypothetical protein